MSNPTRVGALAHASRVSNPTRVGALAHASRRWRNQLRYQVQIGPKSMKIVEKPAPLPGPNLSKINENLVLFLPLPTRAGFQTLLALDGALAHASRVSNPTRVGALVMGGQ